MFIKGGTWQGLSRTDDNFYTAGPTVTFPLSFPITVKITADTGNNRREMRGREGEGGEGEGRGGRGRGRGEIDERRGI